jgi:hypothetical protein
MNRSVQEATLSAGIAAGCVKTILLAHGKARMPALAVLPARLVRGATCRRRAKCPGCRKGSTKRIHGGSGWKRLFDDPIPLQRGRQLVTLEDAAKYIQKLAKAEQQLAEWQAAVERCS